MLDTLKGGELPDLITRSHFQLANGFIKTQDVLHISMVLSGKIPDVYKTLNLTASEEKVLNYIYENVYRCYFTLGSLVSSNIPKFKGEPRFCRTKEKMARENDMSPSTFRKVMRHLAEVGVLTSMDSPNWEDENTYLVGISLDFLNNTCREMLEDAPTKLEAYHRLSRLLYNDYTLASMNMYHTSDPFVEFAVSQSRQRVYLDKVRMTFKGQLIHFHPKRTPIKIERTPIKEETPVERKPLQDIEFIKKMKSERMLQNVRKARDELDTILIGDKEHYMARIKHYYESKCRQALKIGGFCALSLKRVGFRQDKRWKWLEKIADICIANNFDYGVYIDSQFERVTHFKNDQKRPYLNQMFSENAIRAYHAYVSNYKATHSVDGNVEVKPLIKDEKLIDEIIAATIKDAERMQYYIDSYRKRPAHKNNTDSELKIEYISNHWISMSKYYLSTLDWFDPWVSKMNSKDVNVVGLVEGVRAIQKSSAMIRRVLEVVNGVEKELGLPPTPELPEEVRRVLFG